MAATSPLQLTAVSFLFLLVAVDASRPAAATSDAGAAAPVPPLEERLRRAFSITLDDAGGDDQDGGGGMMECWGALSKLGSCTSEIVLFLVNGESYIGDECCRAIRGATRHCWPAMLASVGFTAEEADVLRGFCDGEADGAAGHGGATTTAPPATGNAPPPLPGKP